MFKIYVPEDQEPVSYFKLWSLDQKLAVDLPIGTRVYFKNHHLEEPLITEVYENELDGVKVCNVPNALFLQEENFKAAATVIQNGEKVCFSKTFEVNIATKPKDYEYVETPTINLEVEYIDEALEDALEEMPEPAQADLSVNDPADPAYVKGRTHYVESTLTELLPEIETTGGYEPWVDDFGMALPYVNFYSSVDYVIKYDGVEYDAIYSNNFDTINPIDTISISTPDGAVHVSYIQESACNQVQFPDSNSHTIGVYKKTETITQLDEKYIPDTIARQADVEELFNSIVNGNEVAY